MNGNQMDTTCPGVVLRKTISNLTNLNISSLDGVQYFDRLESLWCSWSGVGYLPRLPQTLTYLDCGSNALLNLPTLPPNLEYLDCYGNGLTSLPTLPSSLTTLLCHSNYITTLPPLPAGLIGLNCSYNWLSSLPSLPPGLKSFNCENIQITSLPSLPSGLTHLICSRSPLGVLPTLPQSLIWLDCDLTQLTNLPSLPPTLSRLKCSGNQLTQLPELPDSMYMLDCRDNPNLSCLPKLNKIDFLYFTNTSVVCLPNYGNVTYSNPTLNSVPLCNIYNGNNCDFFWNINGAVYIDENSNCSLDSIDVIQKSIPVQLWLGSVLIQQTTTWADGFYSFHADSFTTYDVRIDTSNIPFTVTCPANNSISVPVTILDSIKFNNNFGLQCKPGFDLAAWSIQGNVFRPANFTQLNISAGDFTNFGTVRCATGVGGTVKIIINGPVRFASANGLTPASVSGDTITWGITDFGTVNSAQDFNITIQTDTTALLGSQLCFTVNVTPTAGDNNPSNNTITHCFSVVNSLDPNDKQTYPIGDIAPQEWLTYTVRFQNSGTAEAQHIYIDDTLDMSLDESSFQLLGYSHEPIVQVKGKAVRFNFPNINLPDSNANEPESHGYVQYKVKLKNSLSIGTQIHNTAYIYFDFNPPVVTNTVTNTIAHVPAVVSGKILTENGAAVPGVVVSLSGDVTQNDTTGIDGIYSFEVERGGSYTITAAKNNDVTVSNGITGQDILVLRSHILRIN